MRAIGANLAAGLVPIGPDHVAGLSSLALGTPGPSQCVLALIVANKTPREVVPAVRLPGRSRSVLLGDSPAPPTRILVADVNEHCGSPAMGGTSEPWPPTHDAWGWYVVALFLYGALALATLTLRDNVLLLNWIIGPLFPVVVLYAIPKGLKALAKRLAAS